MLRRARQAASQAGQTDIDDAELPPLQQREEELAERATFAEAADAQETRAAWRLWVKTALVGGGLAAHRWVQGPRGWVPVQAIVDGEHRVAPQALLQAELGRCSALWRYGSNSNDNEPEILLPPALRQALPRLTADQIATAGLASAPTKATTFDGIHPRHIGHLCQAGRSVAAVL